MATTPTTRTLEKGFTLVELMVSLTIFSIVMVISTGTLLIMIDINAKAQAMYSSATNLSFALDSMTREIRTGDNYYCGDLSTSFPNDGSTHDCTAGDGIAFTRGKDNFRIGYRYHAENGIQGIQQRIENPNGATGDVPWSYITSDDVVVQSFSLDVENTGTNTNTGDVDQPTIEVLIKGYVNNGLDADTDFNIQTHITQRLLDR